MDQGEQGALHARMDSIAERLRALSERVERIENAASASTEQPIDPAPSGALQQVSAPQETGSGWGTTTTLLSQAATVCFLLVVALILRTVAENGFLNPQAGAALGIGYSSLLVVLGWGLYRGGRAGASVFTVSGALLLYTVVLETHRQSHVLSSEAGCVLLALMGAATAITSRRFDVSAPCCAGVPGMVVAAIGMDLSEPLYPGVAALLIAAAGLADASPKRQWNAWVRAFVLAVSVGFWFFWALRLNGVLAERADPGYRIGFAWYFPLLTASALVYLVSAYRGLSLGRERRPGFLDTVLPAATAVWVYAAAAIVVSPWQGNQTLPSLAAAGMSVLLFLLASLVARKSGPGARGTASFSFAGCLLLAIGTPLGGTSGVLLLPLISGTALGLCVISAWWASGGARVVSYLLQGLVCVFSIAGGAFSTADASALMRGLAAAGVACIAFLQYRWARTNPPAVPSGFFARLDKTDDTAVSLLLAALVTAFVAARVGLYELVQGVTADPANFYQCAQSTVINLSSLALVLVAFCLRNTEVRGVAIVVVIVGALKVFFLDLFIGHGLPLVASVFSFGLATGTGALVLRRWQAPETGLAGDAVALAREREDAPSPSR